MAIDSREVVLFLLPWGQFWNTLKNSFTLFSAYAAMFSIPKGHMFLQSHELEASTLATGRLFFAIHELRERSPKPWFTLSTHFLVEQQSGQLSLCHVDVRSALEPWLSCPDQGFVQRSPGPFCCPAFQDHSKTCFNWMHLCPLFLLASLSPVSQEWPFSCIVSLCLPLDFLLSAGQCVEGEQCASCQVSSEGLILCAGGTNLEVFMKGPQIAITSSEIHK